MTISTGEKTYDQILQEAWDKKFRRDDPLAPPPPAQWPPGIRQVAYQAIMTAYLMGGEAK